MVNETVIRVRYAETDQMGIVYHSNYFVWFEIGRTEFFRSFNLDYKGLEDEDVLLPVIDVGCNYIVPAKYDDEIIIRTKLSSIKGVKIEFGYEIYRKRDDVLLAKGFTKHAFVDKNLKPINFRKKFKVLWEELKASVE